MKVRVRCLFIFRSAGNSWLVGGPAAPVQGKTPGRCVALLTPLLLTSLIFADFVINFCICISVDFALKLKQHCTSFRLKF